MKVVLYTAALLPFASAWPTAMQMDALIKRAGSTGRQNTGAGHPFPPFDAAAQYVDVTESSGHEFRSPSPEDSRGECPGLNAAANHGFLPRSGRPTITETITGLGGAYNMGPDLAGVLAAIAVLISGDIPSLTWSIGGGFPATLPGLKNPKGILGTHDKYEGDASIVRGDAYLNNGNVDVFQMRSWNHLYSLVGGNLNLDKASAQSNYVTEYSVTHNPYYFSGPFSGLVAPAAHNFVVNFFSNHSAENPGGVLDEYVLKTFFAVTGRPGKFVHHKYQERIPYNWYKRPGGVNDYNVPDVFLDLIADASIYPNILKFGGNTGKVNTFTGVDVGNLTGGVFNAGTLLQGNNLACFAIQAAEAGGIDELNGEVAMLGNLIDPVLAPLRSAMSGLQCPQLANFDFTLFDLFPGWRG